MTKPPDNSQNQDSMADLRARAEAALERGDLQAAQEFATRLATHATGPWENLVLGRIALATGDHRRARTVLEAARKRLPEEGSILVHLAEVYAVQKQWADAVESITTAISKRDSIAELHERRATYLTNAGDEVESMLALERALSLEPNRASAWALLGERHLERDDIAVAKKALDRALACDPANSTAIWNLALLAEKTGDLVEAESILTRLIDSGLVDSRLVLQRRGQIRLSLGDLAGGWADYGVRLKHAYYDSWQHALEVPYWSGEDLTGKHLAVWADQGIGEQILTASLALQTSTRAGSLTFACDPRLVSLLSRSFPDIAVVSLEKLRERGRAVGPVDLQA
ncbi:MAG: tetratricopeptide repeat protein, partial [Alphaproteobacteria bacterium]|nr:tetratricopeptide repeat protein [Alphaproteobacteria bacterium]